MPTKKNSEASIVNIDGRTFDFDSLSSECRTTIAKLTNIDGEIAKLSYEMEKSEVYRERQYLMLKQQLPLKSLEERDKGEKPEKKQKDDWKYL